MIRTLFRISLLLCLFAGIMFYSWSYEYPWYTVPDSELDALSTRLADKPRDVRFKEWHDQRERWETPRKHLHDAGVGIIAFTVGFFVVHVLSGFPLRDARTPQTKQIFILLFFAGLAQQIPFSFYYYIHRSDRHEYPWWADSFMIGVFGDFFVCVLIGIVGTLFGLLLLPKAHFPSRLWIWPSQQRRFNIVITIGCVAFALASAAVSVYEVIDGNIGSVLTGVLMMYLFLSLRAGLIEYRINRDQEITNVVCSIN